jgi:hypothetical protein
MQSKRMCVYWLLSFPGRGRAGQPLRCPLMDITMYSYFVHIVTLSAQELKILKDIFVRMEMYTWRLCHPGMQTLPQIVNYLFISTPSKCVCLVRSDCVYCSLFVMEYNWAQQSKGLVTCVLWVAFVWVVWWTEVSSRPNAAVRSQKMNFGGRYLLHLS